MTAEEGMEFLPENPPEWPEELSEYSTYVSPRLLATGLHVPTTVDEWDDLQRWVLSLEESGKMSEWADAVRSYSAGNLYYLLNYLMLDGNKIHNETGKPLYSHEVYRLYCNRTQYQMDNFLSTIDSSGRSFSKSTIRTKAAALQMMIRYPEISMAVVSVERQLAFKQMGVVVEEIDANKLLRAVWSDIFHWDAKEAAKNGECVWSRQDGIRVKRRLPRMNQTLENHAFIGSAPTGSRFDVLFAEDIESEKYVASKEGTEKLHASLAAFAPLLTPVAIPKAFTVINNTMYSSAGVVRKRYDELRADGKQFAFLYPAERGELINERFVKYEDGPCPGGGMPNYPYTEANLWSIFEGGGRNRRNYYMQMLGDATGGEDSTFKRDTIIFSDDNYQKLCKGTNAYVCIDASRGMEDPMGIWVWATATDKRLRWVGGLKKKLDPASPAFHDAIFNIVQMYDNLCKRVVEIRVEQMGSQTWADLIRSELQRRGCHITVVPCRNKTATRTGQFRSSKMERLWSRWAPALQNGKVIFPKGVKMGGEGIITTDESGTPFDLIDHFLKFEFDAFPSPKHDDLLDAGSLIWDPEAGAVIYPPLESKHQTTNNKFQRYGRRPTSWMSAG